MSLPDSPSSQEPNQEEKAAYLEAAFSSFSGPIPPPATFMEYKAVQPDFPDRIMRMAEREQEHTHAQEKRQLDLVEMQLRGQDAAGRRGTYVGGTVVLTIFFIAAWLINQGHDVAGGAAGVVDLVALATVFVNQPQRQLAKGDDTKAIGSGDKPTTTA